MHSASCYEEKLIWCRVCAQQKSNTGFFLTRKVLKKPFLERNVQKMLRGFSSGRYGSPWSPPPSHSWWVGGGYDASSSTAPRAATAHSADLAGPSWRPRRGTPSSGCFHNQHGRHRSRRDLSGVSRTRYIDVQSNFSQVGCKAVLTGWIPEKALKHLGTSKTRFYKLPAAAWGSLGLNVTLK